MSEAVTVSGLRMTSIVSEESLARDTDTCAHTYTHPDFRVAYLKCFHMKTKR